MGLSRWSAAVLFWTVAGCSGVASGPSGPQPGSPTEPGLTGSPGQGSGQERGLELTTEAPAALERMTPALEQARGQYARRIAVTIGIDAYQAPIPPLTAAVSDAQRVAEQLRTMGFDAVRSISDQQATREGLLDLMERQIPMDATADDLVVVYFAGHGMTVGKQGFIVPQDGTKDAARTGISVQRLKESALRMKARHVLYLMDACFSGSMFSRPAPASNPNDLAFWEAAAKQRVVQIITAGGPDETVLEKDGWGSFTRNLHAAMQGGADANGDAVTTVPELAAFITGRVVKDTSDHQHPLWGNIEGTGTVLLWDERRVPADARRTPAAPRPMVEGMEQELRQIHAAMSRRQYKQAERGVRDLALRKQHPEFNLLLAEIYLEQDALGNAALVESELRRVEQQSPDPRQQQRMLDLRARLEKSRRQPF